MNPGLKGRDMRKAFDSADYQVMIVANKFQTGFDQPKLCAMYVDKKLGGVECVQTLSRLNAAASGKKDTIVLDFAKEVDEIQEAFKPYYEQTVIDQPTNPNQLYTLDTKLRQAPILRQLEIDEFAAVFFKPQAEQTKRDHGQLNKWIDPAVARFNQEYSEANGVSEQGEEFKSTLQSYIRLYAFLSQVIDWQDVELEKLYAYGRYLLTKLPYRSGSGMMIIDDEVELTAYRNKKTFEGSVTLGEPAPVYGTKEVGTRSNEDKKSPLSVIIALINDRLGADNWTEEDFLIVRQVSGDIARDKTIASQIRANSKEQFRPVFEPEVMKAFIQRLGRNEKIVNEFMAKEEVRELVINWMLDDVYQRVQERP